MYYPPICALKKRLSGVLMPGAHGFMQFLRLKHRFIKNLSMPQLTLCKKTKPQAALPPTGPVVDGRNYLLYNMVYKAAKPVSYLTCIALVWLVVLLVTGCTGKAVYNGTTPLSNTDEAVVADVRPAVSITRTRQKAAAARTFCKRQKYNTDFCLLADMSLHSGVKRLFIWSFKGDSIAGSFLVGHGCCNLPWGHDYTKDNPGFSNVDGSHCSSLGKYKLGERAYSDWGIHIKYVLHGLESTNSNAQSRYVVLHSWEEVSDDEVYPKGTPEGWGCPIVSINSMRILDEWLKDSPKPVLLWIYN